MAETVKIHYEGDLDKEKAKVQSFMRTAGAEAGPQGVQAGKQFAGGFTSNIGTSIKGAFAQFGPAALAMGGATLAINALSTGLSNMLAKEDQLADFSAITGVTGDSLAEFGDIATGLSNKFGTSTVENIESFKGILSRLGPDIAKSSEAVRIMGEDVNILAKASGLDAPAAMDALTTSVLQFGVDLSDPVGAANEMTRMMNIMAAGAKEGAAEIPSVSEALKQAGATAKTSGLSFAETNAAIQLLATAGKTGSEAGVGLRNVLVLMQKASGPAATALDSIGLSTEKLGATLQGPDGLANATAMLRDGLQQLETPAQRNAALAQIFGAENLVAAQALVANSDALREMTPKLEGTNTALDQAAVKSKTLSEKWNQLTTIAENTLVGALENLKGLLGSVIDLADGFSAVLSGNMTQAAFSFSDAIDSVTSSLGLGKLGLLDSQKAAMDAAAEEKRIADGKDKLLIKLRAQGKTQEEINLAVQDYTNSVKWSTSVEDEARIRVINALQKQGKSEQEITRELEKQGIAITSAGAALQNLGTTDTTLKAMKERVSELTDSLTAANKASVMPQIKELEKQIAALEPPTKKAKTAVDPVAGSLGAMNKEVSELQSQLRDKLVPGTEAYRTALTRLATATERYERVAEDQKNAVAAIQFQLKDPTGWEYYLRKAEQTEVQLASTGDTFKRILADVRTEIVDMPASFPAMESLKADVDKLLNKMQLVGDAISQTFYSIGSAIVATGEDAGKAWNAVLKSLGIKTIEFLQAEYLAASAMSVIKAIFTSGGSLTTDAYWLAAAFVAGEAAKGAINSLGSGGVLLEDQIIQAHAKETVIPFDKAPAFFASAVNQGAGQKSGTTREVYRPAWPQKSSAKVQLSTTSFGSGMDSLEFTQSRSAA